MNLFSALAQLTRLLGEWADRQQERYRDPIVLLDQVREAWGPRSCRRRE